MEGLNHKNDIMFKIDLGERYSVRFLRWVKPGGWVKSPRALDYIRCSAGKVGRRWASFRRRALEDIGYPIKEYSREARQMKSNLANRKRIGAPDCFDETCVGFIGRDWKYVATKKQPNEWVENDVVATLDGKLIIRSEGVNTA